MANSRQVKVIPWAHDVISILHKEVSDFLQHSTKPGTTVFLEMDPQRGNGFFKFFHASPDEFGRTLESLVAESHLSQEAFRGHMALLELAVNTQGKNLRMVPVEHSGLNLEMGIVMEKMKMQERMEFYKEYVHINELRENDYVSKIDQFLRKQKPAGEILVITGATHSSHITQGLTKKGYSAALHVEPFLQQSAVLNLIAFDQKFRNAVRKNDFNTAYAARMEGISAYGKFARRIDAKNCIVNILRKATDIAEKNFSQKETFSKERIDRKLNKIRNKKLNKLGGRKNKV